jgi:ABC-type phosphate transport system substrate-binding protein
MKTFIRYTILFLAGISLSGLVMAQAKLDESLPDYEKTSGVSGNLSSVGSDTLANLMTLWAEKFKRVYPNVNLQIQAAGSSTAPPALTESTSNLGPMSRLMKDKEIEAFEQKHGYKPTAVAVAIDALARFLYIYINKEPGKELDPITAQFLTMVLAKQGQEVVVKDGYIPLPSAVAAKELAKLH